MRAKICHFRWSDLSSTEWNQEVISHTRAPPFRCAVLGLVAMKIAFHSPLPPAPTGVADYSAALLPALRKLAEVEVNPKTSQTPNSELRTPNCAPLYHIGNNHLHRDIYARALCQPGI